LKAKAYAYLYLTLNAKIGMDASDTFIKQLPMWGHQPMLKCKHLDKIDTLWQNVEYHKEKEKASIFQ
jgi:hypothetical protein